MYTEQFFLNSRTASILVVSIGLAAPLGIPRHISFLKITSALSICCVAAFVVIVVMVLPATEPVSDDFALFKFTVR